MKQTLNDTSSSAVTKEFESAMEKKASLHTAILPLHAGCANSFDVAFVPRTVDDPVAQQEVANHRLHEKQGADTRQTMDALLKNNEELTSKIKRLEVALKEERESKQQKKTDHAPETEGELQTVEQQWQMQQAIAKKLEQTLRADVVWLQRRLNEEIQMNNKHRVYITKLEEERSAFQEQPKTHRCNQQPTTADSRPQQERPHAEKQKLQRHLEQEIQLNNRHRVYITKLKEELRAFQEQSKTNRCNQQPTTADCCAQQERPHAEKQRLQQLFDQEIQSHNNSKSVIKRLEEDNKSLMESLQVHEAQTTNASRQGQVKKEKRKYDNLLKDFNMKVEECKALERKNNIHICTLQDLRKEMGNPQGAALKSKVDQACQSEESLMDQEEVKIAKQRLQEQLKMEEQDKLYYKKHLDAVCAEINRLCANRKQFVLENNHLKLDIRSSEFKLQHDTNLLQGALRKEQEKYQNLLVRLNKRLKEAGEEKKALESVVAMLTSKLNQEKHDKDKGHAQMKALRQTMEKEREVFKYTVEKCFAVYQAVKASVV